MIRLIFHHLNRQNFCVRLVNTHNSRDLLSRLDCIIILFHRNVATIFSGKTGLGGTLPNIVRALRFPLHILVHNIIMYVSYAQTQTPQTKGLRGFRGAGQRAKVT